MATKKDDVQKALENLSEAANLLAIHGANGYSLDSSALDVVLSRSLVALKEALEYSDEAEMYDPYQNIFVHIVC